MLRLLLLPLCSIMFQSSKFVVISTSDFLSCLVQWTHYWFWKQVSFMSQLCGQEGTNGHPLDHVSTLGSCEHLWIMWAPLDHVSTFGSYEHPWIMWTPLDHVNTLGSCGHPWIMWAPLDHVSILGSCEHPWIMWASFGSCEHPLDHACFKMQGCDCPELKLLLWSHTRAKHISSGKNL